MPLGVTRRLLPHRRAWGVLTRSVPRTGPMAKGVACPVDCWSLLRGNRCCCSDGACQRWLGAGNCCLGGHCGGAPPALWGCREAGACGCTASGPRGSVNAPAEPPPPPGGGTWSAIGPGQAAHATPSPAINARKARPERQARAPLAPRTVRTQAVLYLRRTRRCGASCPDRRRHMYAVRLRAPRRRVGDAARPRPAMLSPTAQLLSGTIHM
eukprot:scaffold2088_cov399-Prasinococcus_capsulatus_cf.AAC.5